MTVEMIKFLLKVSEEVPVDSLEPKVVFLVKNGTDEEREMTVTLSSWKVAAHSVIGERRKIKKDQERVQVMSKRKTTGAGKPYSKIEKRQILLQIKKDKKKIDLEMEINRRMRTALVWQGNWLLISPSQCPLNVRFKDAGDDELVAGEPLNEGEAAWRMFVLQEEKDLASHTKIRMVKEFFVLRRDVFFKNEDEPGEAAKKLEEFKHRILDAIPDELVPVFKKIAELEDFRKPFLPELETLRRQS